MDRIVEVVARPVATDVDKAWRQLLELRHDERRRPLNRPLSETMAELYRRLLARYPPFEEDPATPWGESPMVLYFGDQLAAVPIVASRVEEALPFVIKTATGLGCTVFDVTGERIHRPQGEQALPASLTADSPWRDRLDDHPDLTRVSQQPAPGPVEDLAQKNRRGMILTGGCLLNLLAVVTLWTALMLYSGLATSLAWGEGDTIWVRQDVPMLLAIASAALVSGVILLIVGARQKRT